MSRHYSKIRVPARLFIAFSLAAIIPCILLFALAEIFIRLTNLGAAQIPVLFELVAAACGVILVVVATIGYITSLTITRPVKHLTRLAKRVADGEASARATIGGFDEFRLLADFTNTMLDNIVRLVQETQSQSSIIQSQIDKVVGTVGFIGEGNLRVQVEATGDVLETLTASLNSMIEELGNLIVRIKMVTKEVETSAAATLDQVTQVKETGDAHTQQVADVFTEIERITTSNRQVAEHTQTLYNATQAVKKNAHRGRDTLEQALKGMGNSTADIREAAEKVQKLSEYSRDANKKTVEIFAHMAQQMNRLALDAAVQAAMGGENRKGIGTVAADMRRLADYAKGQVNVLAQSARGTHESIEAVALAIRDTEQEITNGAQLTQRVGISLETLFSAFEHQTNGIKTMHQMGMQQLQLSSTIVQTMHGVSETLQQHNLSTQKVTQNMDRLVRLVEQLHASVAHFSLRENHAYTIDGSVVSTDADGELDTPFTVSGSFRTVSATAQPVSTDTQTTNDTASPPQNDDPFAFAPDEYSVNPSNQSIA